MSQRERLRFQGIVPRTVTSWPSDGDLGRDVGSTMSANVVERVARRALASVGALQTDAGPDCAAVSVAVAGPGASTVPRAAAGSGGSGWFRDEGSGTAGAGSLTPRCSGARGRSAPATSPRPAVLDSLPLRQDVLPVPSHRLALWDVDLSEDRGCLLPLKSECRQSPAHPSAGPSSQDVGPGSARSHFDSSHCCHQVDDSSATTPLDADLALSPAAAALLDRVAAAIEGGLRLFDGLETRDSHADRAVDGRQRDMFPLPLLVGDPLAADQSDSASRAIVLRLTNGVVRGLNALYGVPTPSPAPTPRAAQASVHRRLWASVVRYVARVNSVQFFLSGSDALQLIGSPDGKPKAGALRADAVDVMEGSAQVDPMPFLPSAERLKLRPDELFPLWPPGLDKFPSVKDADRDEYVRLVVRQVRAGKPLPPDGGVGGRCGLRRWQARLGEGSRGVARCPGFGGCHSPPSAAPLGFAMRSPGP